MDKYRYLAKNTALFAVGSFGSKLLSFLFVSLYTAVLTTEEYGVIDLLTTTSSMLLFFVTLNISDAVIRFGLEKIDEQVGIFSYGLHIILKGNIIFGLILLIIGAFNPVELPYYLYFVLYLNVFLSSIYQLCSYYLRCFDEVSAVALAGILLTLCTIVFNLLLLLVWNWGLVGYLISLLLGQLCAMVYIIRVINKRDKFQWNEICDVNTKKMMLSYSVPLIFNGLAWWINSSLDRYLLTAFCGVAINGVYAVAAKIPTILATCQGVFAEAWSISSIKEYDENDNEGFFSSVYSFYNSISVTVASILVYFNVAIAELLFNNSFFIAWEVSSILVVSMVFNGLSGVVGGIFSVVKETKFYAISTVVAALINTSLNIVLIPMYGAMGAAIATLVSFFSIWLIRLVYSQRFIDWGIEYGKDLTIYCLLVLQVVFDHMPNHFYLGQLSIILVILWWNKTIFSRILFLLKRRLGWING